VNRLVPVPLESPDRGATARFQAVLRAALDGSGPAVAPLEPGSTALAHHEVPDDVALVVRTSGTGGQALEVMLGARALEASAAATHDRLGGPGRWVLALPLRHIAGVQVLVRSLASGTEPAVVPGDGFDPGAAADVVRAARIPGRPLYAALVPTQLHRILAACDSDGALPPALGPWAGLDAILVGGAASPPGLLRRAHEAGLRVVTTYGMTETCGGCVYDGVPLAGVSLRTDDGTVSVAGPVLARGYLGRPELDAARFGTIDGVRWLRTADLGVLDGGRLTVLGRQDDVIVTGGQKVDPAAVEEVLALDPDVDEVCVVGVADDEWGELVAAVVVPRVGAAGPDLDRLRRSVGRTLGPAAAPRRLVVVDGLPHGGPGKVDRAAAAHLADPRP
jgi:O-succinylbenzoic acid--CoA ligase